MDLDGAGKVSTVAIFPLPFELGIFFGSWLMNYLGFDLFWVRYARKRLHNKFRSIAMTRYVGGDGLSIWGCSGWLIGLGLGKLFNRQISR